MLDAPDESQPGSELLKESSDPPPASCAGLEVSGADEYVGPVARPRAAKRFEFIARYCSTILLSLRTAAAAEWQCCKTLTCFMTKTESCIQNDE
jgi:hypothetical protein